MTFRRLCFISTLRINDTLHSETWVVVTLTFTLSYELLVIKPYVIVLNVMLNVTILNVVESKLQYSTLSPTYKIRQA